MRAPSSGQLKGLLQKPFTSSMEHLVNSQSCLKGSFDPDAAMNYAGVNTEQLVLGILDLFYINTSNIRLWIARSTEHLDPL